MPDLCTIETRRTDSHTVARLIGEVDASNAASIDEELRAIAAAARSLFVIDLNDLQYIDSAGIAALERLANDSRCRVLIGKDATTYETLKIVRFNAGYPLYETLADALNSST
jgi:anti-sigma B factor antagonist